MYQILQIIFHLISMLIFQVMEITFVRVVWEEIRHRSVVTVVTLVSASLARVGAQLRMRPPQDGVTISLQTYH